MIATLSGNRRAERMMTNLGDEVRRMHYLVPCPVPETVPAHAAGSQELINDAGTRIGRTRIGTTLDTT